MIIWLDTFDSFEILCSGQIPTFESCNILETNSDKYCGVCPMKISCTDLLHLHIYLGWYSSLLFFSKFQWDKHQISFSLQNYVLRYRKVFQTYSSKQILCKPGLNISTKHRTMFSKKLSYVRLKLLYSGPSCPVQILKKIICY